LSVILVGTARGDAARQERRLMTETWLRTVRLATHYLLYPLRNKPNTRECDAGACA
jgi:hypothetical protein